jgi:hypothetical protein
MTAASETTVAIGFSLPVRPASPSGDDGGRVVVWQLRFRKSRLQVRGRSWLVAFLAWQTRE